MQERRLGLHNSDAFSIKQTRLSQWLGYANIKVIVVLYQKGRCLLWNYTNQQKII